MRSLGTPVCSCHPIGPCIRNPVHHHPPCNNTMPILHLDRGWRDLIKSHFLTNRSIVFHIHSRTEEFSFQAANALQMIFLVLPFSFSVNNTEQIPIENNGQNI
ncbi:hypothetical protein TNCV_5021971 [Trichonephila clavipes]|nr:hypothetical protein TNCV_5021971 [Trichonephila clavipes]